MLADCENPLRRPPRIRHLYYCRTSGGALRRQERQIVFCQPEVSALFATTVGMVNHRWRLLHNLLVFTLSTVPAGNGFFPQGHRTHADHIHDDRERPHQLHNFSRPQLVPELYGWECISHHGYCAFRVSTATG